MSGINYDQLKPEIKDAIRSYERSKYPERGLHEIAQKLQRGETLSEEESRVFMGFITGMNNIYGSGETATIGWSDSARNAADSFVRDSQVRGLVERLRPDLEKLGYKKKGRFGR